MEVLGGKRNERIVYNMYWMEAMPMARKHLSKLAPGTAVMTLAIACAMAGAWWWLKAQHRASEPVQVAQAFVAYLKVGQFAQAHGLTMKNPYTGRTVSELADISRRNLCQVQEGRILSTFPFQSNGNRLRRWLMGQEVEMSPITIEFAGNCPFNVTVRRTQSNDWKVSSFQSHAG
ncbi:hypothetical protein P3W85_31160 [Cupriavidus basilensis]|uniref:Uncharacterized protein n=1 Tax=Cupriavidus basilensis TaxID=68895 RepID=A0ABT6AXM8_9BURK|nr:hypothetical protein [Cupriavidus basilensis]MDF3837374.1 hypothetical protein [Cupriavidus basilensis]